ncbi:MAG: DUF928 domain-containing protein [Symploca sp. SIO1B1]|nr:DUF928 domain-containing protein [Symploca sp. SIO1B1]
MKLLLRNLTLCFTVILGFLSFTNSIPEVLSQDNEKDLSDRGTISDAGTGSRDDCIITNKPLTALVPTQKSKGTPQNIGLTVSGHPTFFFYLPQTHAQIANFTIVNTSANPNEEPIYHTEVPLPRTPGVISVTMPSVANSQELQVDENYKWTFAIVCNEDDRAKDVFVEGVIQLVHRPDLAQQSEIATLEELPAIYAQAGIWHETLTTLDQLRRANPNDTELAEFWANVLTSVGLGQVAEEPLLEAVLENRSKN